MYTKLEIHRIFKNCDTMSDLYLVSKTFNYLITRKLIPPSKYIVLQAHLRFRELLKPNKNDIH